MISTALLIAMIGSGRGADCAASGSRHVEIHWSRSLRATAPDGATELEVRANLQSESNASPVLLRDCRGTATWPLFTLQRRADVYWSDDGRHLLVVDAPLDGTNTLLLFSIDQSRQRGTPAAPAALEQLVQAMVRSRLGDRAQVIFYLPTFVSWRKDELLMAVGGEAADADTGPLKGYCFGLVVDTNGVRTSRVLSARELRAMSGAGCRTNP